MRRRPIHIAILAVVGLVLLPACDPPPPRPVFEVTTTTDALDADPGDGVCEATSGTGDCTLRAAIAEANAAGTAAVVVPPLEFKLTVVDPTDGDRDLDVTGDLHLNAGIRVGVRIISSGTILDIATGAKVTANGLTLSSESATAIRTAGTLILGESGVTSGTLGIIAGPAIDIGPTGAAFVSNSDVSALSSVGGVLNRGLLVSQFSRLRGFFSPGLRAEPGATSQLAATIVAQWGAFHGATNEASGSPACAGVPPISAGYNRVPNTSCGLTEPTDLQFAAAPYAERVPVGVLGCGTGYTFDLGGNVRPGDGNHDGVPACDTGPFEGAVSLQITAAPSSATLGQCYSTTLAATGGYGPYVWTVTDLPPGLTQDGDRIVGIPQDHGTFSISIAVRTDDGYRATRVIFTIHNTTAPPVTTCPA